MRALEDDEAVVAVPSPVVTDQLAWLVDRAHISDLLIEFARALGRARIQGATSSEKGLGGYRGTWHGSSNHAITTTTGDTATTRSYLTGLHLRSDDPYDHADGMGWYDCALTRTGAELAGGWRFTRVRITEIARAGRPMRHVDGPAGG